MSATAARRKLATADESMLLSGRVVVRRERFELNAQLRLSAGERLAVIGRNGAGKSTLLGAIAGLVDADRGSTITLNGQTLQRLAPEHRSIGYLAQDGLLFPHLDVLRNVAFGAAGDRRTAHDRARHELEFVGAAHLSAAQPGELSGGERQRIALARALATDARLVVLDEPFAALDVDAAAALRELVARRVTDAGISLLIASHELVDVVRLAERVLVLDAGEVCARLNTSELRSAPADPFAATFAGLAHVRGTVADGEFRSGALRVPLQAGISCRVDAGAALLVAAADEVTLVDEAEADDTATQDTVERLVGDGTAIVAQLRSGLRARIPAARPMAPGMGVQIHVRSARVIPDSTT